jgi:hypothetical protein
MMSAIFLWSNFGEDQDRAFAIIPDESADWVQHQYACVGCHQFEIKGRVELIPDEIGKIFERGLGCDQWLPEEFALRLPDGWEVETVIGEGLCKLKDGRYVATCNCD